MLEYPLFSSAKRSADERQRLSDDHFKNTDFRMIVSRAGLLESRVTGKGLDACSATKMSAQKSPFTRDTGAPDARPWR